MALAEKNIWLERVYGVEPLELEELAGRYEGYAQRLRPFLADTSLLVDRALHDGKRVLLEGAHGTLLDIDHGTYPSSPRLPRSREARAPASGSGRRGSMR